MEDEGGSQKSLEVRADAALRARLNDFKAKADTLTLEGIRRVLEKDLGLKTMELDSHKKFVKQCMDKYFYGPNELTQHAEEKPVESTQSGRDTESQNNLSKSEDGDGNGLSVLSKDTKKTDGVKNASLDEEVIKKAIKKRATYLLENSGNITMTGVRRLLEGDLKAETKSLDKYKDLISKQLDQILSSEVEPSNGTHKNKIKRSASPQEGKTDKKSASTSDSDKSGRSEGLSDQDESDSEGVELKKVKKRSSREQNELSAQVSKKQIISSKTSGLSSSGRKKSEEQERSNDSEDSLSDSMIETSKKKKETPTVYGKKVEHLKSVIKACGMSVPPSIYTKAKQAPDSKREAFLIKELEGILEKEGLSSNPSEKEIKNVRKKKERAKELEGIDLGNIVSSSRRTTASFVPPKPPMPLDESEEEEEEDDEEDTDDENSQSGGSSEEYEVLSVFHNGIYASRWGFYWSSCLCWIHLKGSRLWRYQVCV